MECDRCGRLCSWLSEGWWCWFCARKPEDHRDRKSGVGSGHCVEKWPCKPMQLAARYLDVKREHS